MQLGVGEFYIDDKEGKKNVVDIARKIFLNKIQEFAPQVWENLYGNCFPIYSNIAHQDRYISWEELKNISKQNKSSKVVELHDQICKWSQKYNLNYDWVLEAVMVILLYWFESGGDQKDIAFTPPFFKQFNMDHCIDPVEQQINFSYYWDPLVMTKQEFKRGAKEHFNIVIDNETNKIIELMEEKGYKRVPEKRVDRADHFKWAVCYIVLKWSFNDIAQDVTSIDPSGNKVISIDAIKKGISDVASLIDIDIIPPN